MLNQNSSYGRAMLDALHIPTVGKIFIVMNSSDDNYDEIEQLFKADNTGTTGQVRFYNDIATAYAAMDSNRNDVMIIGSQNTHNGTSMITVEKNRCHFIGLDWLLGAKRHYGQGAKISLGVTTAATDIATFKDLGVRNSFHGIKFINNNTVDEGIYCYVDGGEYGFYEDCEFYKSTDMDVTGAAELVCNGDSSFYKGCTFGSLATARSGAVIRPCVLFTKGVAGTGKVARDVRFEDCIFWINASNTANRFVYGANATDIERIAVFKNCEFINNGASSAVPAQNIAFGSALTVGSVLLKDCTSVNAGTAMSTTTGVFVDGAVPTAGTTGISVQAT